MSRTHAWTPEPSVSRLGVVVFVLGMIWPSLSLALQVVASTSDLGAIAQEIGGRHISVETLCSANQDPHSFEIVPRMVLAVRRADLYLKVGAGLDYWTDDLLKAAGNGRLRVVDCSRGITLIHQEKGVKHGHGEHEAGNPHYWLGPVNIPVMAKNIAEGLEQADSNHAAEYEPSLARFVQRFDSAFATWKATMLNCHGAKIITYHRSWDYFTRDFEMEIVGTVEPHPGAEPSPETVALLEDTIRREHVGLLLVEPFESDRLARLLARDTGISVVTLPPSVGGSAAGQKVFSWFDFLTREISLHCAASQP